MPLLKSKPDAAHYSDANAVLQDNRETKRSKKVPPSRSKKVPPRVRRSASKDAKILRKISAFGELLAASPDVSSSVVNPTPLRSPTPRPANDNLIPKWDFTSDMVKAVFATGALLIADKPAYAFTFDLSPEAIAKAKAHPAGFMESLKRSFDKKLARAGLDLLYWFAIDITEDGRLHIHGAFLRPAISVRTDLKIRKAMRDAWGAWTGPGDHKQISFRQLYSDDWAMTYCMRNQRKVAKIIGRTLTINQPLRRDAESTYSLIRRIMRQPVQ